MRPKVSLIVAAYNIEQYIKRCINSLVNQTFKGIEIIVVNDGSTDNTLNEIQQMAQTDPRIKVINQTNKGVMKARETGLKKAIGEYVIFIDGDDWLAEEAIKILYKKAKQNNYDIVCYKYFFSDGEEVRKSSTKNIAYDKITGDEFLKMIMTSKINPSLWSKLMKRKFISNNNVAFPNGIKKAQDLAFSCSIGLHSPHVCLIDEYLYYYFYSRSTSVTNTISPIVLEVARATDFIEKQLKENNKYKDYKEEFEYLAFIHNFWVNREMIYNKKNKFSKALYKNWKNIGVDIKRNKYFKESMISEPLKIRVISQILISNYTLGSLFYKFYNLYILLFRKSEAA
ncbi:glycosyltransferase [Salipaludibacillus sp. CUR1]|uniref:glycosyltransferase family 2 protein n=1 Tax=Salipaludibacillus sp. CUR1 TaxID=2820003 RepID=UPI001E326418|nr:glycosyltransferase [Salipaludibacillus sp. CUR1]